jgi:predicted membrane protein
MTNMANNDEQRTQPASYREQRRGTSWGPLIPVILVATVLFIIFDNSDASDRRILPGESTFSDSAFLGGIVRKYDQSTFRRGEAQAVMGGIDLDFRDATIEGDEARLEITALMGGVKIRVPRNWSVVSRVTPILGGVEDRTTSRSGNKRLVIEGTVVMGGLDIRN